MQAICNGDYKFAPAEFWVGVSDVAKNFVRGCLTVDPTNRPTVVELLNHPWLKQTGPVTILDTAGVPAPAPDLLPNVRKAFDAKKTFRRAVLGMMAVRRLQDSSAAHAGQPRTADEDEKLKAEVAMFKAEAERVSLCLCLACSCCLYFWDLHN
jgi:hypothetical protein